MACQSEAKLQVLISCVTSSDGELKVIDEQTIYSHHFSAKYTMIGITSNFEFELVTDNGVFYFLKL